MVTKKQKEVLNFITSYQKNKGYAPSLEEICKKFKLASVSTAHFHVKKLEELGYLNKKKNQPRAIELNKEKELVEIRLAGTIAAGEPIEAIEEYETVIVHRANLSNTGEHFALKVKGDSMIDEGIFDGDTVIIKKQNVADNGETIVAIINGNEATLKKIYKHHGGFRLQPANPEMKPIFVKNLLVQGKVISVLRNFENQIRVEQISGQEKYITSKEYSGNKFDFKQLTEELVKLRDILLFKNGFNVENDFLKTQIIDGLILQEVFKYITTAKKLIITNQI